MKAPYIRYGQWPAGASYVGTEDDGKTPPTGSAPPDDEGGDEGGKR